MSAVTFVAIARLRARHAARASTSASTRSARCCRRSPSARLVLGIIEGPIRGWSDPLTVAALRRRRRARRWRSCCWELRTEHPLLDPRLFRHRGFATGSASLLVLFIALFGIFLVILQYLQLHARLQRR